MRRFFRSLTALAAIVTYLTIAFNGPVVVLADPGGGGSGNIPPTTTWCAPLLNVGSAGVLINGQVDTEHSTQPFACYISHLLSDNMPYVIIIAVVLVIWSGIEYMLAQGTPAGQAKAKQRIIGIISGLIFYFLIRYLLPLIVGGISL